MKNHRSTARRRLLVSVAAAGLLAAVVVATPAGAEPSAGAAARPGPTDRAFTRTVEEYFPGHPPTSPPSVLPRVTCVRPAGPGRVEAVFGYENPGLLSQYAPIGDGDGVVHPRMNQILHRVGTTTTVVDQGPQVTEFLPGSHPYGFSLTFPVGEVPTWKIAVPPSDPAEGAQLWWVEVTPTFRKTCGPRVPAHFSVVQTAALTIGPANMVYDPSGNTLSYDVQAGLMNVTTACSEGGTPQPYDFILGWSVGDTNLVPLPRREVIKTVRHSVGTPYESLWQNTRTTTRLVTDLAQQVHVEGPSADITGICTFPDGSTAKSLTFWEDPPMGTTMALIDVDGHISVRVDSVLPGGVRTR